MPMQSPHHQLELPARMRSKLEAFRRRVWTIKLAEGVLAAAFGLMVSYLLVFVLDRIWETPAAVRGAILLTGALGLGVWLPWQWYRWVWCTRRLEAVARLLRHAFPRLGDQLLGIVELVRSELEQERSETLCRAAMNQVDEQTSDSDFSDAVPNPRHRTWARASGASLAVAVAIAVVAPTAGANALARWLMPWKHTARYTFAQLVRLPDTLVVPYAEPFSITAALSENTAWSPWQAFARYGGQTPVRAEMIDGGYLFPFPPQTERGTLTITAGDAKESIQVEPTTRPELTSMTARIELPGYLQYPAPLFKDVRGGSVSVLKGSHAVFEATATRTLATAAIGGVSQRIVDNRLVSLPVKIDAPASQEFTWTDNLGLSAKQPFVLSIKAHEDEPPTIWCSGLSREQVVLDEEVLSFHVRAADDFGVQSIGMEWRGVDDPVRNPHPAKGEKVVAVGQPDTRELDLQTAFSAGRESIPPQTLVVRLFTVDYLPGRERVYSPEYVLHVLSPEEHAIWITNQMRNWFRQAREVYEREGQLYETNREIRDLPPGEIDRPENRRRIETQAAAESLNARRLSGLTNAGEELVKQAARNDQFNVATLESLAEMVQALRDIAGNRMPSVADLLKQAASAPGVPGQPPADASAPPDANAQPSPPAVGQNQDGRSGQGTAPQQDRASQTPSIVDVESGFNELDNGQQPPDPSQSGAGRLTLPGTAILGGGPKQPNQNAACPAQQKVDEAVQEQEDLLAEFAKVAKELNRILDNLEGSTFVKRLKAASRRQLEVASDLNRNLPQSFGISPDLLDEGVRHRLGTLSEREVAQSDDVYSIQEDLDAYYNRVRQGKFKTVLSEMKSTEVVIKLRDMAGALSDNLNGQTVAHTEYWADTLDRWAEQLVGPG